MLFIIAGHFVGQSGLEDYRLCANDFFVVFLGSGSRIGVNVFLLIGIWYMVGAEFQASRILKIYGQVIIYSAPLTVLMLVLNQGNNSLKEVMRGFLPFLGRGLWFASAYITLIIFTPFLNKILRWEKRKLQKLLILLIMFVPVICTLPDQQDSYVLDTIWFQIIYLMVGYIKRYPIKRKYPNVCNFLGWLMIYSLLVLASFLGNAHFHGSFLVDAAGKISKLYLGGIVTIPNFLCAWFIFQGFLDLPPRNCQAINMIAKSTFSVYIIHSVPAFWPYLWTEIFKCGEWISEPNVSYIFVVAATVYTAGSLIDIIRREFLEPIWVKSKLFAGMSHWIDAQLKDILV